MTRSPRPAWNIFLPLLVLIVVLGSTLWLALDRDHDLAIIQGQFDASARLDLAVELDNTRHQIDREVDRLTELIMGLTAFVGVAPDGDAATKIETYLDLTGARERFPGLIEATVIGQTGTPRSESDALVADLSQAVASSQSPDPLLTTLSLPDSDLIALSFPLEKSFDTTWASLIFTSEAFLARATVPRTDFETTVENAGLIFDATTDASVDPPAPTSIAITDDGRLVAHALIDVLGTAFTIRIVSQDDFLETTSRTQVWILMAAGAAASLGLYAAVRSLIESRTAALETAANADEQRAAIDRRFRASFDSAPIGMAEIAPNGTLVAVNAALCTQVGLAATDVIGRSMADLVHAADRSQHHTRVQSLLTGTMDASQGEHRFDRPDGAEIWVHESISVIRTDAAGGRSLLVQAQDITAQKGASSKLAQRALHDELTQLPNRSLFLNRLRHCMSRNERLQTQLAVMFIDIDRFKVVNDSLGHDIGDDLLVQIAKRMQGRLRVGDTVARFGGDEFVVLCEEVSGDLEATATAERIQEAFTEPFLLDQTPTYVTASIGICLSTDSVESADALLRDADVAMYRAKESGRNRIELFDRSMRTNIVERMELESQLRDALTNGEIVMYYQAIVDPVSHMPVGYEALMRWNHPARGLLGPGAFLPIAEDAGLMHLIDAFALESACRQIASWADKYPAARNLYVAINWSTRHLGRFAEQVERAVREARINPHQLVVEVTEGFLLEDTDASIRTLDRLRQLGVQIAIDDFGTGYSSLAYLTQFAVDFLKIDRSFIAKLPDDEASKAVVGAIADMATRLGIQLVAEGVETDEQIEVLATMGAPRLQGYRFDKPRPVAEIEVQLHDRCMLTAYEEELASVRA